MKKFVIIGLVLFAVLTFLILVGERMPSGLPAAAPTEPATLPFGDYTLEATVAATSLSNVVLFHNCLKNNDEQGAKAMLADGRAYLLESGTRIEGMETHDHLFHGTIQSGRAIGIEVYVPIEAVKR